MGLFSSMKMEHPREIKKNGWKPYLKKNKKQLFLISAVFFTLAIVFSVGVKSILVMSLLVTVGAITAVLMSYSQLTVLSDFTLFGGIVATYLFGPWFGLLVLAAEYAVTSRFVHYSQVDFPVGAWFAIVLLFFMPKIGFDSVVLKLMTVTLLGDLGNVAYWFARGTPPGFLAFGAFVKFCWYLTLFLTLLPKLQAFIA